MSFNNTDYVKNLPDAYAKAEDSNNYKILSIEKHSIGDLKEGIDEVLEALNLDAATGKTLDLYGAMINQPRGTATDEQYLMMIRAKIARNSSGGDYSSVARAICLTFNCNPSQVLIAEKEDSCKVDIVTLPLDIIMRAGFSPEQTTELIQQLLPIGITIDTYSYEGTFEFGDINEYDETKGFADMEGTIGGYFGLFG